MEAASKWGGDVRAIEKYITRQESDFNAASASTAWARRLSRQLSVMTDSLVGSRVGVRYSRRTASVVALNMTLGTGPLMLPFAFAQAGLILGAIFLAFCCLLAYMTATFIIETLMLENADLFEQAEHDMFKFLVSDDRELMEGLRHNRPEKVFKFRERIEMGEMGARLFPRLLDVLLYTCLFLHIFGCLCVYAVTLTASVESFLPDGAAHRGAVVLGLAFVLYPLCFVNVQKLRAVQFIVMFFRAVAVVALIGGACYLARHEPDEAASTQMQVEADPGVWMWGHIPLANFAGLPSLYSNAVLAFMVHHALPGFLAPLDDPEDAPKAVAKAYIIAYFVYIIMAATALWAFGTNVPPLYNLAFSRLPVVFEKCLCGYPLLLLAVYPVIAISLRNNLMNFLRIPPPAGDGKVSVKDVLCSTVASLPPLGVAYVTSNVQAIVKIFAGYFGLSLMLFWPCVLLKLARRLIPAADDDFPLRSRWGSNFAVGVIIAAWASAIAFNTYRFFLE